MSRTPARCTQADIARAIRAVEQIGGNGWIVDVLPDGTIRIGKLQLAKAQEPQHADSSPAPKPRIIL